jgi:WD40 repeat protein/predicted Ser/Thr protein kinase
VICPKCGQDLPEAEGTPVCPHCGESSLPEDLKETAALGRRHVLPSVGDTEQQLREFAGYEIQGELGRGGMGVVYKAFDPELKRTVALKVLLSAEHAGEDEIQRFFREAESAARLQHPNIVPIHELKIHEGKHYYTMDYIDGTPLDELIKDDRPSVRRAVEIMEKVARGLEHAHRHGIIHRDLKPANIIIDEDGEPRLFDFGLAKVLSTGEETLTRDGLTQSGIAMGTTYYMAPEQAAGHSKNVDARSDVYALGCILYELLSGAPPFVSSNGFEILRQHIEDDPAPPSSMGTRVNVDVGTICLKCLEKEPERRYQTASELAEDLKRYLEGQPIAARRASLIYVTRKKLMRHKAVAGVIAAATAALVAATAWYILDLQAKQRDITREKNEAIRQRDAAKVAEAKAEAAEVDAIRAEGRARAEARKARYEAYIAKVGLAAQKIEKSEFAKAERLLKSCLPEHRHWEWGWLRQLCSLADATLEGHTQRVNSVAFYPNGKRIVSCGGLFGEQGEAKIWDVATGKCIADLTGHQNQAGSAAVSPDNKVVATVCLDGKVRLWNASNGAMLRSFKPVVSPKERGLRTVAFSPDGKHLVVGGGYYRSRHPTDVRVLDFNNGKVVKTFKGHTGAVFVARYSRDGTMLITGGSDRTCRLWDTDSGKELLTFTRGDWIDSAFFLPNGQYFVMGYHPLTAELRRTSDGKLVRKYTNTQAIAVSSGGKRVLLTRRGNFAELRELSTDRKLFTIRGARGLAQFSPDGKRAVTGGWANSLKIWRVTEHSDVAVLSGHKREVSDVVFSPKGDRVFTGCLDDTIGVWDSVTGRRLRTIAGSSQVMRSTPYAVPSAQAHPVSCSPDGRQLLTGSGRRTAKVLTVHEGRELHVLAGHRRHVICTAISADGSRGVTGGLDGRVILWDLEAGKEVISLASGNRIAYAVGFLSKGRIVYAASGENPGKGHVRLWDARSGKVLRTIGEELNSIVTAVAFTADERRVALGTGTYHKPGKIVIWDADTGRKLMMLKGHVKPICTLAFTPDGRRLASGSEDGTAKIWDPGTGRELLSLVRHTDWVWGVSFSPDGRKLSTASKDGTAIIWSAADWTKPWEPSKKEKLRPRKSRSEDF